MSKTNERLREIRELWKWSRDMNYVLARLDEVVKLARAHLNDFDNEFGSREKLERCLAELEKGE